MGYSAKSSVFSLAVSKNINTLNNRKQSIKVLSTTVPAIYFCAKPKNGKQLRPHIEFLGGFRVENVRVKYKRHKT